VEVYGGKGSTAAETWIWRPAAANWEKLATQGAPPGARGGRMVWAAKSQRLIYWATWASQLWAFDPKSRVWEDLTPKSGPKPEGFCHQGMAYDSLNDAVIMFGSMWGDNKSLGPWVYSFPNKTWMEMKPAVWPYSQWAGEQMLMDYDSEYNVVIIAGNARYTWVYRYKGGVPKPNRK
jgi:hypothetical protein